MRSLLANALKLLTLAFDQRAYHRNAVVNINDNNDPGIAIRFKATGIPAEMAVWAMSEEGD